MKLRTCAAVAALSACGCAADARPTSGLSWLSGYWLRCVDSGQVSETWSAEREGVLLGINFTSGGGKASWEFLRVGPSATGTSLFAMPSGQPPAEFPLSAGKSADQKAVFENLAHDFPQRIIYSRNGDTLTARIEGMMDGKLEGMEWQFSAAPLNKACGT